MNILSVNFLGNRVKPVFSGNCDGTCEEKTKWVNSINPKLTFYYLQREDTCLLWIQFCMES